MSELHQYPRPGVTQRYCLSYSRDDPTFFVIEVDDDGHPTRDIVEWWEPISPVAGDLPEHESWRRLKVSPIAWINSVEVVGVVTERGRFGPGGDHVRQLHIKEIIRVEALPCG
jgi:hypothetical protein